MNYILLMKTDQSASLGVLSDGVELKDRQSQAIKTLGGEVHEYLHVTGAYDLVLYVSLPDDAATLTLSHMFNLAGMYTEVLRAFSEVEFARSFEMSQKLVDLMHSKEGITENAEAAPSQQTKED